MPGDRLGHIAPNAGAREVAGGGPPEVVDCLLEGIARGAVLLRHDLPTGVLDHGREPRLDPRRGPGSLEVAQRLTLAMEHVLRDLYPAVGRFDEPVSLPPLHE